MQTFLPYPSFTKTAKCLDYRRLGKQRIEALQILRTLTGQSDGWKNHPAVRMWEGSTWWLASYGAICCQEWIRRGYKDTTLPKILEFWVNGKSSDRPVWLFDDDFHRSHQSNLVRKQPEHYRPLFPDVPDDLEYVWPV